MIARSRKEKLWQLFENRFWNFQIIKNRNIENAVLWKTSSSHKLKWKDQQKQIMKFNSSHKALEKALDTDIEEELEDTRPTGSQLEKNKEHIGGKFSCIFMEGTLCYRSHSIQFIFCIKRKLKKKMKERNSMLKVVMNSKQHFSA